MDVDGGAGKVQTWECSKPSALLAVIDPPADPDLLRFVAATGNSNQVWTTGAPVNPPPVVSSTSIAPPTSTSSSAVGPGPSGVPSSSGIHPFGVEGLCLSVAQPFTSGSKVLSFPCNGGPGQDWIISRGSTKVCLRADPNYCLDAGVSPNDNNVELKVWEKLDVQQQQWYFTDDNREQPLKCIRQTRTCSQTDTLTRLSVGIAIEGGVTCVDIRDGSRGPGAIAQTYRCTPGNVNQVMTVFSRP